MKAFVYSGNERMMELLVEEREVSEQGFMARFIGRLRDSIRFRRVWIKIFIERRNVAVRKEIIGKPI